MALQVHVVYVKPQPVVNGIVINKDRATIGEICVSSLEMRVVEDPSISNSSNSPTIKQYLELEAQDDFKLTHMDNDIIVTYKDI